MAVSWSLAEIYSKSLNQRQLFFSQEQYYKYLTFFTVIGPFCADLLFINMNYWFNSNFVSTCIQYEWNSGFGMEHFAQECTYIWVLYIAPSTIFSSSNWLLQDFTRSQWLLILPMIFYFATHCTNVVSNDFCMETSFFDAIQINWINSVIQIFITLNNFKCRICRLGKSVGSLFLAVPFHFSTSTC